jgi:hypothetical protein
MYRAGLSGAYDALGVNANAQAPQVAAPLGSLKDFPHPSFYFRRVEQLRQVMVDNGDAAKRVWLMEWGWTADTVHPAYAWFAVNEQQKADNVVEVQYAPELEPWMGVMVRGRCLTRRGTRTARSTGGQPNPGGSPRPPVKRADSAREWAPRRARPFAFFDDAAPLPPSRSARGRSLAAPNASHQHLA